MYKDRASLAIDVRISDQPATRAADALGVLNTLKESSRLPLVLGDDNGSPFVANEVICFLDEHKVIQLKSLPRVPQQNGAAENAVGEVKRLIRMGVDRLNVCSILNGCRKRASPNWKTAREVELENTATFTDEERTNFYYACKAAIEAAVLGAKTAYEKRKAEREAIFQTLESFNLITRSRGLRPA